MLRFTLFFCIFSFLFSSIIYFSAKSFLQKELEQSSSRALDSVKAIVDTSINIAVSNYLRPLVQLHDKRLRDVALRPGRNKKQAIAAINSSLFNPPSTMASRSIDSYLVDVNGELLTATGRYLSGDSLWEQRDANGFFYFQNIASIARALPSGETASTHYRQDGQVIIVVFSFIRELNWLVVSSSPRNALTFFSRTTGIIRDELVAQKVGKNGSIEIFNERGLQYVHSAKQFEDNIRLTKTHEKIRKMVVGEFTTFEHASDVNSLEYISTSAQAGNDRLIKKQYRFTYLPDLQWYLVIGVDLSEVFYPLTLLTIISLVSTLLFIIFIVFVSIKIADRLILDDIEKINCAINQFKQQEFSTRIYLDSEDELGRLALGFNEMASTLEAHSLNLKNQVEESSKQLLEAEKMAAIGKLGAGFAHEINTPIGIGITASSLLSEQISTFNQQVASGSLKKSELNHFLNMSLESCDILTNTLSKAGKLVGSFKVVMLDQSRHELRDIALKAYILDIFTSLKHEHKRYQLNFIVNCPSTLYLHCDPANLYQIFNNLIINSLRHGLTINEPSEISIDTEIRKEQLVITYRDNGIGISDDILPHIFEPFFTTRRESGGSGIGLQVVVNVVQRVFNGTIDCRSDKGAIFTMRLPSQGLVLPLGDGPNETESLGG